MNCVRFVVGHFRASSVSTLVCRSILPAGSLLGFAVLAQAMLGHSGEAPKTSGDTEAAAALDDARYAELLARPSDVVALRLDDLGKPIARLDLHFGAGVPTARDALFAILDQFEVDGESLQGLREKDAHTLPSKNILLPDPPAATGLPDVGFFDPQRQLAIEFRRVDDPAALTCSGAFGLKTNATGTAGQNYNWYTTSDAIVVAAGPGTGSGADPDCFINKWNGSSYVAAGASTAPGPDALLAGNDNCSSSKWRFRVHMQLPGKFFACLAKLGAN